ncbi:MAG: hypothetical protein JSS28_08890 [Proteobacteria bacterium]|nr:hypothetical protein [Pseudomonadota bacterium]
MSTLTCSTITLATGLVVPQNDLVLQGPGARKLSVDTNHVTDPEIVDHQGAGTLQVKGLKMFFYEFGAGWKGTGIKSIGTASLDDVYLFGLNVGVQSRGLSVRNSTFYWNSVGVQTSGGPVSISASTLNANATALKVDGPGDQPVLISNSTISSNFAAGQINHQATTVANSTIAFNQNFNAPGAPGGLQINSPQVTIQSSILANNAVADLFVSGAASIAGNHNLVMVPSGTAPLPANTLSTDPKLQPLADNGGPTRTHALGSDSPAIDRGNNSAGLATDQRGYPRQRGAGTDIGAFEVQSAQPGGMIGPGYTGSWYDPNQSGHGLAVEVLDGNQFLAYWFTFNPDGTRQAWFVGVGTYAGNTAAITAVDQPAGGRWIPNFDPNKLVHQPWGTMTITFTDCNHGRVDFASTAAGFGNGHMDLTRLTLPAGLTCQ